MNQRLKETLSNLYDLANDQGATDGEKKAARKAMERIIKKYNLADINLDEKIVSEYRFKYCTKLEIWLLDRLRKILLEWDGDIIYTSNYAARNGRYVAVQEVVMNLDEFEYITLECAYEYFRRHMKNQWNKFALPILKRCRKSSTRRKKRELLQEEFFQRYCIASKLYKVGELTDREINSQAEAARARAFRGIKGGVYNKQMNNGLYLGEGHPPAPPSKGEP